MINAKIEEAASSVKVKGDVVTITAEASILLRKIQRELESQKEGNGTIFAETIKTMVTNIIFE